MSLSEALNKPKTYHGRMVLEEVAGSDPRLVNTPFQDILIRSGGNYWSGQGDDYVSQFENAQIWRVRDYFAARAITYRHEDTVFILGPLIPPAGKKCLIQSVLGSNLITNLKAAPVNKTIRTAVHAAVLQPVPDDLVTYETIKEWIENNIDATQVAKAKTWPVPDGNLPALHVRVRVTEYVTGRARFDGRQHGSRMYDVTVEELLQASAVAALEGTTWDEFMNELRDRIRDLAVAAPPELELDYGEDGGDGTLSYESHEITDYGDREEEVDYATMASQARNVLQRYRPDLLERLQ